MLYTFTYEGGSLSKPTNWGAFIKSDMGERLRLIWAGYGEHGTGKTTFGLTAPGPICVQSFDFGLEGVVNKFQKEKDIYIKEYDWSPGKDDTEKSLQDRAIELRDEFIADFELACKKARTVLWDKESDVWELFRYAEFGAPNDAPRNYPELNQRYRHFLRRPHVDRDDMNFGIIQGVKDKWVSKPKPGEPSKMQAHNTGELVRTGFSELGNIVQVDIWHTREKGQFYLNVGKSRQNSELQDQRFEDLTFTDFAQLVFPDSTEKDWQ